MLGVMRETFESEGGSISGEEDFFSVARTMPFVAVDQIVSVLPMYVYRELKSTYLLFLTM